MTPEREAEIRELRGKITPAPWHGSLTDGVIYQGESGGEICEINYDHQTGDHDPIGDLEFIADAPLMVDDLLAEIDHLRTLHQSLPPDGAPANVSK